MTLPQISGGSVALGLVMTDLFVVRCINDDMKEREKRRNAMWNEEVSKGGGPRAASCCVCFLKSQIWSASRSSLDFSTSF